jgi:hypothetical protein
VDYILEDRIRFICEELNKSLLPIKAREDLIIQLAKLVQERKLMLETLAKENNYFGTDDSSDPDESD